MMARPVKCSPEIVKAICDAVSVGIPFETACNLADITPSSGYRWLRAGQAEDASDLHATFYQGYKRARAKDEARRISNIAKAGKGGSVIRTVRKYNKDGDVVSEMEDTAAPEWKADAWHLERAYWKRWSKPEKHEISGNVSIDLEIIEASELTPEARQVLGREALLRSGQVGPVGDNGPPRRA